MLRKKVPLVEMTSKNLPKNVMSSCLNVGKFDFDRKPKSKKDYWIHVSEIIRSATDNAFCPREYVLSLVSKRVFGGKYINPGQLLIFSTGHSMHDHVRNRFIKNSPYGKYAWGVWKCACGKTSVEGYVSKSVCASCETSVDNYNEVSLRVKSLKIVAHPDFLIKYKGIFYLYEIKSIERKDVDFDAMKHPLGDHTLQASFYYWILKFLGYKVSSEIRYVYGDRSTKKMFGGTVYKEFAVKASNLERINPIVNKANVVKYSIAKNKLPTRICEDYFCKRASNCSQAVTCFNLRNSVVSHEDEQ